MVQTKIIELFPDNSSHIGRWNKCQEKLNGYIQDGWKVISTTSTTKDTCVVFLLKENKQIIPLND